MSELPPAVAVGRSWREVRRELPLGILSGPAASATHYSDIGAPAFFGETSDCELEGASPGTAAWACMDLAP